MWKVGRCKRQLYGKWVGTKVIYVESGCVQRVVRWKVGGNKRQICGKLVGTKGRYVVSKYDH